MGLLDPDSLVSAFRAHIASAADGKTTGYRDSVGLFIRLPKDLAEQFPSLAPEDNSPPHVTFLYVGEVTEEDEEVFLETVHKVFAQGLPTIKAKLIGLDHFDHPDKERRVAHCAVRFSASLSEIRARLRSALEDAGLTVGDSFPVYRPHVTLAYMPGLGSKYEGPVPEGEWEFDEIEVWGLPKEHRVKFHGSTPGRGASDKIPGGLGDKKKPSDFDQKQLAKGMKVEMEHTDDEDLAREIAMDHLTEDPHYYTKLETIEKHSRAIPIDKSGLRALTKRLEKRLSQAFTVAMRRKAEEPIRYQEVWARELHTLRNVMGHDIDVDVLVTAGKDRSGGPFVAAGGYGKNRQTGRPVVIVKLNGSYSPKEYLPAVDTGMLTQGIYDILIHEMTHAADAEIKAKYKAGPASGAYVPDDIAAYYNDPKEVRAYMQQVVDEVLRYGSKRKNLEKVLELFKGPRQRGIEVILKNTETWPEIEPHLTDANKAKILKAVYRALDDEGLLKGASSMWTMTASDLVQATAERRAAYFGVGDQILYGKYKNKKGIIVGFGKDEKGNPTVEIEPYPKGRKQNKTMTVFKIWHADPEKRASKQAFVAEDGWDAAGNHRVVLWPDNIDEESVIHTVIRPAFEQAGYDASTVSREMDNALGAQFLAERFAAAKYKDKHEDKDGNVHYEYSEKQVEHRHREKAKRIEGLRTAMPKLRKQVEKDLSSDDPKTKLTALAIALIDETYERPGNDESAEEGHVGVTGWQTGQISFGGKGATIKYTGKSGVKHKKSVTNAKVVKALREIVDGSKGDTKILAFDCEGEDSCVSASDVNSYLKDFGVTAKDLRGYHANDEMKSRLRALRDKGPALPRPRKEKDEILKKEFEQALEETAEIVGHEPATLRKDYLVPGLEDSYLHNGSVEDRHTKLGAEALVMLYLATKDKHEREEEEAEKLVRKEPKKKPPREDLRKERVEAEDDPDLEKPNATNDRDLSHNYKGRNARSNRMLHPVEYDGVSMGGQFYLADVREDRFVHFTPSSRALGVLKDGKLKTNPPYQQFGGSGVYAISLRYGAYVPGTQVTHIDQSEGEMTAIVFETTAVPERGYVEEVVWNRDVPLKRAKIMPARQAIGMLSRTPERIGGQDQVFYKQQSWMKSAAEQWWEGKKFPHKTPDGKTTSVGWKSLSPEEQAKYQKEHDDKAVEKSKARRKKKEDKGQRKEQKGVAQELKDLADNPKLSKRIESMAKGVEDPADLAAKYEKVTGKKMSESTAKAIVEAVKAGGTIADVAEQKGSEQAEQKSQESAEKGVRQVKRELSSLVKGADLPDDVKEKLQETFRDMSPADRKTVLESMKARLKENLGSVLDTETAAGMIETTDMEADLPSDLESLGQELADRAYVQNVVLNPMMAGGNAVTDTEKSQGELEARATEALAHYRELKPEHRKAAGEKLLARIKEVGEGSHEAQELNAILDGIALAGALEGETIPGRPPPSALFSAVARGLEKRGEAATLLKATDLNSTEARDAMRRGLSMLDNKEFAEAVKGSELLEGLGDRMNDRGTSVRARKEIRKVMEDLLMDDMTFVDPMIRDSLEAQGKKEEAVKQKSRESIRKEIHKGGVKISLDDLGGDAEAAARARRNLRFGLLERTLAKLDKMIGKFPSMSAAMVRTTLKEKDLDILDQQTHDPLMRPADVAAAKPPKKESSAQSAAYTPNLLSEGPSLIAGKGMTGPESPRAIRRNETMTQQLLTKKGAEQIQDHANRLAHVLQHNWKALGVPSQEHALDLAYRLDLLGDTVAKKADTDHEYIQQKLAAGKEAADSPTVAPGTIKDDDGGMLAGGSPSQDNMTTMQNGYDPSDIGKLKPPAQQEPDEPYMDAFVQDEYHQLADLQERGQFSNAKAAGDDSPKAKVLAAVSALGQAVAAL